MAKTKLCIITTCAELPIMGGIHGPLHTPSPLTYREIITLINNGIDVYEVNPKNRSQKVKLTAFNAVKENFATNKEVQVVPSLIKDAKEKAEDNKPITKAVKTEVVKEQVNKPEAEIKNEAKDKSDAVLKPDFC